MMQMEFSSESNIQKSSVHSFIDTIVKSEMEKDGFKSSIIYILDLLCLFMAMYQKRTQVWGVSGRSSDLEVSKVSKRNSKSRQLKFMFLRPTRVSCTIIVRLHARLKCFLPPLLQLVQWKSGTMAEW